MKEEKRIQECGRETETPQRRQEGNKIRSYFLRLFDKYDVRNERKFINFCKWLIFVILMVVQAFLLLQHLDAYLSGREHHLAIVAVIIGVLTASEGLQLFVVQTGRIRLLFFILDALAAIGVMLVAGGSYSLLVYVLVLTEFYMRTEKTRGSFVSFIVGVAVYIAGSCIKDFVFYEVEVELLHVFTRSFAAIMALGVHFVVVSVAQAFYRQFIKLDKTLKELDESKKELEKAYEVVAEVTALEERQRIAKEIHDTAGHSLTTVIMQTEAAKLIIDEKPEEAKAKIVAANLQAKHALEELRDSVHLLSGSKENQTLKGALEDVIHESTDGTGIVIRSEIAEVNVSEAKFRFLCNTLKEGISNGLRHGGATAFWFELKANKEKIEFLLSDNGKGAPMGKICEGFGLTTMRDRAKSFGGEVAFDAQEDEGFELRMTLPTDKEE